MVSKLANVAKVLNSREDIVIVDVEDINNLLDIRDKRKLEGLLSESGYVLHRVTYTIAPKKGAYTEDGLERFMMGLARSLNPDDVSSFIQTSRQGEPMMYLGFLSFKERLTPQQVADGYRFLTGERIQIDANKPYKRFIWIAPYPDEAIARDILTGKVESPLVGNNRLYLLRDLERYKRESPQVSLQEKLRA